MKRIVTILIGLFGVFVGMGFIMPAIAKMRDFGAMPGEVVVLYTIGVALALGGIATAAFGLIRRSTN